MHPVSEYETIRFLASAPVAHLGVISDDEPYVMAVSFVVVGREVRFRVGPGRCLDALRTNPRVCVEACRVETDSGDWMSAVGWGEAREITAEKGITETVELLLAKYRRLLGDPLGLGGLQPLPAVPHVVAIELDTITGTRSGSPIRPPRF